MSSTRNPMSPLRSHDPLTFASKSDQKPNVPRLSSSRLNFVASWKLNSEAARGEPRLRNLLGHLSIYEETRTTMWPEKAPAEDADPKELSAYIQQHAPSFQDFQTAIALQLAALAQIQAVASVSVKEYGSDSEEEEEDDEEEEEEDYDSHDGNLSDNDTAAESDDSYTDYDISEGQWSPCSSPTSSLGDLEDEEDEAGLWAIRPLAPIIKGLSKISC